MVDHWRRSHGSCLWETRICATDDIRQDLIGHNAPTVPRARHGHSGYGGGYGGGSGGGSGPLAGHWKEDVTCKVSNPLFTNLTPEVTSTKNSCSLDDFLVVEIFVNEGS